MNQKLEAIAAKSAADFLALVKDGEAKILAAWQSAEEQAALEESKPKFKLAFAVTLDLDADTMSTDLSWSVKHHLSINSPIPDPAQPELPVSGDTVTIKTPGIDAVTVPFESFQRLTAVLKEMGGAE